MSLPKQILDLAVQSGCSDPAACQGLIKTAFQQQKSVIIEVLDRGGIDERLFLLNLSQWLQIPWIEFSVESVPDALRQIFPARMVLTHHLLPFRDEENRLWMLTYDPFNLVARQAVSQTCQEPLFWAMSTRRQILEGLRGGYGIGAETFDEIVQSLNSGGSLSLLQETTVLDESDTEEASVVKFVNQILREALRQNATDIHVEPLEHDLRIRYRVDGVLHETPVPDRIKLLQESLISRLKIMAHLDIAERRLPQDGRINLELEGQPIDVRVATIPTVYGESVSLRLLGQERFEFERLQLPKIAGEKIQQLLSMPNGIILLTGPTGCGKSTTLYTFLSAMNTRERRVVTIEDPVEHKLPGVMQIAVKPDIHLTFATALRSILRGDPNVIMVGEMRDFETAEIAIRSALTGHLVFSTLHTNDAVGGITRLIDMGVEPFLVASAVRAFIAQRLVRVVCPKCKAPASYPQEYLQEIGFPMEHVHLLRRGTGCDDCRRTGYQGRCAIFEICLLTPRLQNLVTQNKPGTVLRPVALEEGMTPLRQAGWEKTLEGITTVEEIVRVTSADIEVQDE